MRLLHLCIHAFIKAFIGTFEEFMMISVGVSSRVGFSGVWNAKSLTNAAVLLNAQDVLWR